MPRDGAITLSDLATQGCVTVAVRCLRCPRAGRYSLAGLMERFGDEKLPAVAFELSRDCPKRQRATNIYDRCDVLIGAAE